MVKDDGTTESVFFKDFAEERLPLFRTHPLFGVRPHKKIEKTLTLEERAITRDDGERLEIQVDATTDWTKNTDYEHAEAMQQLQEQKAVIKWVVTWLKEKLEGMDEQRSIPGIRNAAVDVAQLLDSDDYESLAKGLTLLSDSVQDFGTGASICEDEDFGSDDYCLLYEASRRLHSSQIIAAIFLENAITNNKVRSEDVEALQEIIKGLKSEDAETRRTAEDTLIALQEKIEEETEITTCHDDSTNIECTVHTSISYLDDVYPFSYRARPEFGGYYNDPNNPWNFGYTTVAPGLPLGPRPIGMGNKYIMEYDRNFDEVKISGIDNSWYPGAYKSLEMRSMGHYLMTSMLCGPDSLDDNGDLTGFNDWLGVLPYFKPPRVPLTNNNNDYCGKVTHNSFPKAIWDGIRNENDSTNESNELQITRAYKGFADLMYHELSDDITGEKFKNWWQERVLSSMIQLIESRVDEVQEHVNNLAVEALTADFWFQDTFTMGEPTNITENIVEEFELYFETVFDPIYDLGRTNMVGSAGPLFDGENADAEREEYYLTYWDDLKVEIIDGLRSIGQQLKVSRLNGAAAYAKFALETMPKMIYLFQTYDEAFFQIMKAAKEASENQRYLHPMISYGKQAGVPASEQVKAPDQKTTMYIANRAYAHLMKSLIGFQRILELSYDPVILDHMNPVDRGASIVTASTFGPDGSPALEAVRGEDGVFGVDPAIEPYEAFEVDFTGEN